MQKELVLVINPGSTSTKLGLFTREEAIHIEKVDHSGTDIADMHSIADQLPLRIEIIDKTFKPWIKDHKLVAVVGRGGLLKPIKSGVYSINDDIMSDTINCKYASHASNLGASIAYGIAQEYDVPSYIVDPVTVDEFIPEAKISGVPEIRRRSRLHALNINACVRKAAAGIHKEVEDSNFIIAHLGGGISIAAVEKGRIIDCNDALLGMGPFSPERAGALPIDGVIGLARKYTDQELKVKLTKQSGIKAYLGTNDMKEVEDRISAGDEAAALIFRAMIYQIAKELGAMATTLCGDVDGVIITGGQANSTYTVDLIYDRVGFIAPKIVFPGENELESMAEGGFRAADGLQDVLIYRSEK